jgi:hypothetical protein
VSPAFPFGRCVGQRVISKVPSSVSGATPWHAERSDASAHTRLEPRNRRGRRWRSRRRVAKAAKRPSGGAGRRSGRKLGGPAPAAAPLPPGLGFAALAEGAACQRVEVEAEVQPGAAPQAAQLQPGADTDAGAGAAAAAAAAAAATPAVTTADCATTSRSMSRSRQPCVLRDGHHRLMRRGAGAQEEPPARPGACIRMRVDGVTVQRSAVQCRVLT